jgi:phosphatidylglycerophosphatase A
VPEPAPRPSSAWATLVATGLGSGYSPVVPGTAGSAVGLLLFWPLPRGPAVFLAIAALFVVGAVAAGRVAERTGRKDPGIVVVDEIVGMWTALALLPATPLAAGLGFVLFRLMDVWKPYPARDLERLPAGWGIMADDLMAGLYANLLTRVALLV